MTSAVCTLIFAAKMSMGCGFGGLHHQDRPVIFAPATIVRTVPEPVMVAPPPVSTSCEACGVRFSVVDAEIYRMQHDPRWRKRDNAANRLRDFDWQCHPQIVPALITTMLRDCHEEVREEAAESLAKMAPCLPEVHAALAQSARCDPDHATRKWASRGLERVGSHCQAPCSICGPVESEIVVGPISQPGPVFLEGPATIVEPPLSVEPLTPGIPGTSLPPVDGPVLEPLTPDPSPLPPPTLIPPLPPGAGEVSPLGPLPEARRSGGRVASVDRDANVKVQRVSSRDDEDRDDKDRDQTPNRPARRPLLSIFRIGR